MNIAFVNMAKVLDQSKPGKALGAKLRTVAERWHKQVTDIEKKLAQTQQRAQKSAGVATLDSLFNIQREQRLFEIELSSLRDRSRVDLEMHREFFRRQLFEQCQKVCDAVAKERQLDAIVAIDETSAPYLGAKADLTEVILEALAQAAK